MVPDLLRHRNGRPPMTIPLVTAPPATEAGELAVTWLGHATTLVEIDGQLRADRPGVVAAGLPVDHRRARRGCIRCRSPSASCPALSAVVISHDHYDHLDLATVRDAGRRPRPRPSSCPSASAPTCARWGVPEDRIVELDWEREHHDRRDRDRLHPGPALLRPRAAPQHHPVELLGAARPASPGVLRRRHRLHHSVRRDRPPVGAVRRDDPADRRVQRPLAGHPPQPGGGGRRAPRPGRRAAWCRSTGRPSTWRCTRGPSRCGGCRRPARTFASPHPAGRTRRPGHRSSLRMAGGPLRRMIVDVGPITVRTIHTDDLRYVIVTAGGTIGAASRRRRRGRDGVTRGESGWWRDGSCASSPPPRGGSGCGSCCRRVAGRRSVPAAVHLAEPACSAGRT